MKKLVLAACLLALGAWPLSGLAYHSGESVVVMPVISSLNSSEAANSAIQAKIEQMHANALAHVVELEKLRAQKPPHYQDYYYNYAPVDVFIEGEYVSVVMEEDTYTGGAHGIRKRESVVFRLADGKIMTATEYLGISDQAFRQLVFRKALEHTDPNFRWTVEEIRKVIFEKNDWQFALDRDKGPIIIFGKYELAPGAAGFIRVPLQDKNER